MRTLKLPLLLAALTLTAVSACENPADNKPKAEVGEARTPVAAGTSAAGKPESLAIAAESSVVGFVGSKVTGKHDGGFKAFTGTIAFDPAAPEQSQITVDIDAASIWTDTEKLTRHLKSADFFDVEHHPKASFVSTSIKTGGASGATHTITGNLALHGVTKSVTFPATVTVAPEAVSAKAEFVINRKDWNLVYAGMPDDLIRDEVVVTLEVTAPRT